MKDFKYPQQYYSPYHIGLHADLKNAERYPFVKRTVLNKYSTHSMLNELERIFQPEKFSLSERGLIEVGPDAWQDCQANHSAVLSKNDANAARDILDKAAYKIKEADVVIFTLGLTEVWKDNETGLILNHPPNKRYIEKMPKRFSFFNSTFSKTKKALLDCIQLLENFVKPDIKIILTVSPVPLGMTFNQEDIIVANNYSKSQLVTVAREICSEFKNVDYYPSYEIVMNSPFQSTWKEDRSHPKLDVIEAVIERFIKLYFDDNQNTVLYSAK
ncbi:GSCFA domain-containing protein [uncultured Desulfobacter sp.]|uniref:GSCFA domain-containing protein n=1 Tax=uncultured Desulfobacter sp. TaxID=240139 RepID=UPI002AAB1776|nr:GSCFA domain-containing protein [uncultured Desulfobacter sp.]